MKRSPEFSSVFLPIVAVILLFSLPAQVQPMTVGELDEEVRIFRTNIEECEIGFNEMVKEVEKKRINQAEIYIDKEQCDYRELDDLERELDKLANLGAGVIIPEERKKKLEALKNEIDELQERNANLQKRWIKFEEKVGNLEGESGISEPSELATEINRLLREVLEKQFGPLNDLIETDETQMYGRIIAIAYELPEGIILDDSWGHKVVKAIHELGINGEYTSNEVRADGQSIAGEEASHMQITTGTADDYTSVIGFTARFANSKNRRP